MMIRSKGHKSPYHRIFFIALVLFSGCSIEHQIAIKMDDDKYSINYLQLRDFDDIPFLYPENNQNWEIIESSDVKLHYKNLFNYGESIGALFTLDTMPKNDIVDESITNPQLSSEIILNEPVKIMKKNYFIFSNYMIDLTFKNRSVSNHYDKLFNYYSGFYDEISADDGKKKDVDKTKNYDEIVNQLVGFLFLETINKSDLEFNKKGIYLNSLRNWDKQIDISKQVDDSLIGIKVNKLFDILSKAKTYLYSIVDENDIDSIKQIWDEIEFEILVTHLLLFNSFLVELDIPGNLIAHNADSTSNNNLYWSIDTDQFMNSNYKLYAKSKIYHKNKIIALVIIALVIGALLIQRRFKK